MKAVLAFIILFPSISLCDDKPSKNDKTVVVQTTCAQEVCTKSCKDRKTCGNCCYQKYRFTNMGSDDKNLNFQKQTAELKPDVSNDWDECLECCKTLPESKKSSKGKGN